MHAIYTNFYPTPAELKSITVLSTDQVRSAMMNKADDLMSWVK